MTRARFDLTYKHSYLHITFTLIFIMSLFFLFICFLADIAEIKLYGNLKKEKLFLFKYLYFLSLKLVFI